MWSVLHAILPPKRNLGANVISIIIHSSPLFLLSPHALRCHAQELNFRYHATLMGVGSRLCQKVEQGSENHCRKNKVFKVQSLDSWYSRTHR